MKTALTVILAVLCLLAVLLIIAAIRAILIKAKPADESGAVSCTPEEENKYAETLSAMIRVPTVSVAEGGDKSIFYELHKVLRERFPLIFEKLEVNDLNANLLVRWPGKDSSKDALLLMGHQDVVPAAENNWEHEPFSGDIEGGKIHGRGAMDCKCTVFAEWQAVEELLEEGFTPERDLYLSASTNEEIGGGGVQKSVEFLKDKGIRLAVAMDEGGAIVDGILPGMSAFAAAVGLGEKGTANIKFTAKSAGGHSSTPPRHTPFARIAEFINDVEKHDPFKAKLSPAVEAMFSYIAPYLTFPLRFVLGNMWLFKPLVSLLMPVLSPATRALVKTTYVFTMSEGSKAPNVIPSEATVVANIRPSFHQNLETCFDILKNIAAKYDIEAEIITGKSASAVTDLKSEELAYLGKCVNECLPGCCFAPYVQTGGTDCREMQPVTDNCLRFTPIRMDSQQLAAMHAANENIGVADIAKGVKFYKYWIKNHN